MSLLQGAAALASGALFGIAQEKGQVVLPDVIMGQFTLQRFTMMKFFLSAAATSFLSNTLLYYASSWSRKRFLECREKNVESDRTMFGTVLGAGLLGSGMALSATCPGTIFSQVGATGFLAATPALFGGVVGVLLWSFVLQPALKPYVYRRSTDTGVEKQLGVSLPLLSTLLASVLYGGALFFEWLQPDQKVPLFSSSITHLLPRFSAVAWNPIVSGLVLGSLQIPLMLLVNESLGASSGFVSFVSYALNAVIPNVVKKNSVLSGKMGSFSKSWQIWFLIGAALGSFFTSHHQSQSFNPSNMITPFFGGLLMLLGSRMGDGCTSGHGITGMSQLSSLSFAAVAAMFGAAIGTGFLLKATGL